MDDWICIVCSKENDIDEKVCCVCGRPRERSIMSITNEKVAKPHMLHGENALYVRPEQLSYMIEHGFDIDATDSQGWTPIIACSRVGAADIVTKLVECRADLEAKTHDGWRAIHHAADTGHHDSVSALVAGNVDINARIKDRGDTPLHIAATKGYSDIINILAQHGADLELKTDSLGQTALHLAAFHGNTDAVEMLLLHGANVQAIDDESASPYQIAMYRHHNAIQLLLKEIGRAPNDDFDLRSVMDAARDAKSRNMMFFGTGFDA